MKCIRLPLTVAVALACAPLHAAGLGADWQPVSGTWQLERELLPMIRQASTADTSVAFATKQRGTHGAWRATVQPSLGTKAAGIWAQGDRSLKTGFLVVLGGTKAGGGFALKAADGKLLWRDGSAPWMPYHPYVLECVVERGKVRAQLFASGGEGLISQSPWVTVPEQATEAAGMLGLHATGIARFWHAARADKPLSPVVADAPNKRRLGSGPDSQWSIVGPGQWNWTTGKKDRLRQSARVERTKAVYRAIKGVHRKWECRVKVDPGTGGTGMFFQCNDDTSEGLLAWLGGRHGNGSLMLYTMPAAARWSGKQGNWRYNTEYVIRAETRKGEARVQLLKPDGTSVIQDSKWVKVGALADTKGYIGFHTWKGTADFWGFSEGTQAAATAPKPAAPSATQLGGGWQAHGDGAWRWTDKARTRLLQTGKPKHAVALNTQIAGVRGAWRCRVRVPKGTPAAGLVFQASPDLKQGFICLLDAGGVKLQDIAGKTMWEDTKTKWTPGTEYVLEGRVMTDRVAVSLLAADGKTVLANCPDVYVPDTNNTRRGHLGLLVRGGPANFAAWQLKGH